MNNSDNHLDSIFRALGEASTIVLLSCGTYFGLSLEAGASDTIDYMCFCGMPLLAFAWFVIRLYTLSLASDRLPRRDTLKVERRYPVLERATLTRITTPTTKKKKHKNDAANSDLVYVIQGHGTQATDPVDLEAGLYRLAYQSKPDVKTTVKLIQCLSGEEDVLLKSVSGTGSQTFTVTEADRYLFQVVVPGAQFPAWKIEVERL